MLLAMIGLFGSVAMHDSAQAARAVSAAPTITSIKPAAGPLGTKIVITGTGFTGASSVQIDGTTALFTVTSDTRITANVPPTGSGPITVTNAGSTAASSTSFTVTPSIASPVSFGHESSAVTITGAGFAPYSLMDLYFDTTDVALAVSNSLGVVRMQFPVPTTAQPGTHWITLDARTTGIAAQRSFTVNTNWSMLGVNGSNTGSNPYENTLSTSNVSQLTAAWSQPDGGDQFRRSPIIEANGNLFTGTASGTILSYSSTGALLWSSASSSSNNFSISAPAASASLVFFASGTSVYAYEQACRTDGGVCTPTWTATIGATVSSDLTIYNNTLYAPGSDGNIYPLTLATGAVGTPFDVPLFKGAGTATSRVTFGLDGTYYLTQGSNTSYQTPNGHSSGYSSFDGQTVSAVAESAGRAFFTSADGTINSFTGWSAPTSGTGCAPAPVVAGDYVYAGGCTSIAAFEAGSGELEWTVTTTGPVIGVSVANGVIYACVVANDGFEKLVAYDATYDTLLWSGGECTSAPVVANGTVYAAGLNLTAYTLPGLNPNYVSPKPVKSMLRPNFKLSAQRTPN